MITPEDDDFGFTAVSEEELKQYERELETVVNETNTTAQQFQQKLTALYKAIMPLLNNLEKNPDKEYILWPDRASKIAAFKKKIDAIVKE